LLRLKVRNRKADDTIELFLILLTLSLLATYCKINALVDLTLRKFTYRVSSLITHVGNLVYLTRPHEARDVTLSWRKTFVNGIDINLNLSFVGRVHHLHHLTFTDATVSLFLHCGSLKLLLRGRV
jgi:hypothetical protein